MTISVTEAVFLLRSRKRLTDLHAWDRKGNRDNRHPLLIFRSRVSIETTLPQGLWFRIIVNPQFPDTATFQLDIEKPRERSHLELYRLDWRPPTGHSNGMGQDCPEDLRGLVFAAGETHEHICTDNLANAEGRLRASGMKDARKIEPDFGNYDEALSYVCDRLLVENGNDIPPTNAQTELF